MRERHSGVKERKLDGRVVDRWRGEHEATQKMKEMDKGRMRQPCAPSVVRPPVIQQDVNEKVGWRGERGGGLGGGDESDQTLILYLWFDSQRQRPACCPQGLQSITVRPFHYDRSSRQQLQAELMIGGEGGAGAGLEWRLTECRKASLRFNHSWTFDQMLFHVAATRENKVSSCPAC